MAALARVRSTLGSVGCLNLPRRKGLEDGEESLDAKNEDNDPCLPASDGELTNQLILPGPLKHPDVIGGPDPSSVALIPTIEK